MSRMKRSTPQDAIQVSLLLVVAHFEMAVKATCKSQYEFCLSETAGKEVTYSSHIKNLLRKCEALLVAAQLQRLLKRK